MRICHLVPALGVLALIAPAAGAQEIAKGVILTGWVDTIFKYNSAPDGDDTSKAAPNSEGSTTADFSSAGKVALTWSPTERVSTKIGVKASNNDNANFEADELWGSVDLTKGFSWTIGKYIGHLGWTSYEPTGLFRVNGGLVPSLYTVNPIGTYFAYDHEMFNVQLHLDNGYANSSDTFNNSSVATRGGKSKGTTLSYGVDATYKLPNSMGSINVEFAIDPAGSSASTAIDEKGASWFGVNFTVKPVDKLTVAGEYIAKTQEKARNNEDVTDEGVQVMGNYAFDGGIPMSATVMFNEVAQEALISKDKDGQQREFSAALLTNPLESGNFGLNFEVAVLTSDTVDNINGAKDPKDGQVTVSVEALFVLP